MNKTTKLKEIFDCQELRKDLPSYIEDEMGLEFYSAYVDTGEVLKVPVYISFFNDGAKSSSDMEGVTVYSFLKSVELSLAFGIRNDYYEIFESEFKPEETLYFSFDNADTLDFLENDKKMSKLRDILGHAIEETYNINSSPRWKKKYLDEMTLGDWDKMSSRELERFFERICNMTVGQLIEILEDLFEIDLFISKEEAKRYGNNAREQWRLGEMYDEMINSDTDPSWI